MTPERQTPRSAPGGETADGVRVVYISGAGRSGSTIVDRVLGTLPGVTSHNEIHSVWARGVAANDRCGCGVPFAACPFWQEVLSVAYGGPDGIDAERMLELQQRVHRTRRLLQLTGWLRTGGFGRALEEYRQRLAPLYFAIARVSGKSVILDSSKIPAGPPILSGIPGIAVHVVHLVRDGRAVVHSWRKRKFDPGMERLMDRHGTTLTTMRWMARNLASERLAAGLPYHRVRYEDLMRTPRESFGELIESIDALPAAEPAFVDDRTVALTPIHSVAGNPQRMDAGETPLEMREEWRHGLPGGVRAWVTGLAWPVLLRYGYL